MPNLNETGRLTVSIPPPFSFALTVAKPAGWHWSTPREVFRDGTLWGGTYIFDKPVGIKMSAREREVAIGVYAQTKMAPAEMKALEADIRHGLGEEEDLNGFYAFAQGDALLAAVVKDLYGMRTARLDDVFARVILAISLQMAPLARSQKMMDRLLEHYGTKITFDGKEVVLWPQPELIARVSAEELRTKANLGYRAGRLVRAAEYLERHPLSLRELSTLDEAEAMRQVRAIPGIGEYSAGLILGRYSVPLDVWSVVIVSELMLKRTPENPRQEIETVAAEIKRRWGKWSWMAFVYILNDLASLSSRYRLTRLR